MFKTFKKTIIASVLVVTTAYASDEVTTGDIAMHNYNMCERYAVQMAEKFKNSQLVYLHAHMKCMAEAYEAATEVLEQQMEEVIKETKPKGEYHL